MELFNHIHTSVNSEEKRKLYELALTKKGGVGIEIGSYFGASACVIASALEGTLYCVDIWENAPDKRPNAQFLMGGAYLENRWIKEDTTILEVFIANTKAFGRGIVSVIGRSEQVVLKDPLATLKADLLFVDGDHTYEGVKRDWDGYRGLLKPGAVAIFHDYCFQGVRKLIDEEISQVLVRHGSLTNLWWGYVA